MVVSLKDPCHENLMVVSSDVESGERVGYIRKLTMPKATTPPRPRTIPYPHPTDKGADIGILQKLSCWEDGRSFDEYYLGVWRVSQGGTMDVIIAQDPMMPSFSSTVVALTGSSFGCQMESGRSADKERKGKTRPDSCPVHIRHPCYQRSRTLVSTRYKYHFTHGSKSACSN